MEQKDKKEKRHIAPVTSRKGFIARYNTIQKRIDDYMQELDRHNRYKSFKNSGCGWVFDDRSRMIDLYEMALEQDAHLRSVVETVESQILGDRYSLGTFNDRGGFDIDDKATEKIQGTSFETIIKGIMESRLYGYTLIEIFSNTDKNTGKLSHVKLVERRNVLPDQNQVVLSAGNMSSKRIDICSKTYRDNYILVNTGGLGLFSTTTPLVLAKKFTFGSYVNFAHTYGLPIIHGKTSTTDLMDRQRVADEIASAINDRVVVTGLDDTIDVKAMTPSNSERIYVGLLDIVDRDISNVILGSESMAGGMQSYVGSTKAHQDIFRDRIDVYRKHIENTINEEVIPRLVKFGYLKEGYTFRYSKRLEMSTEDKIKLMATILPTYEVDEDVFRSEFGIEVKRRELEDGESGISSIDNGDGIPQRTMSDEEYYKRYGGKRGGRPKKKDDTEKDGDKGAQSDEDVKSIKNYLKSVNKNERR